MKNFLVSLLLLFTALPAAAGGPFIPPGGVYGGHFYVINPSLPIVVTFLGRYGRNTHTLAVASLNNGWFADDWQNIISTGRGYPGSSMAAYVTGHEVIFKLFNHSTSTTYFGNPAQNPDGIPHTIVVYGYDSQGRTLLGFEEQFGGGDRDYDDALFLVNNVAPWPVLPPLNPGHPAKPTKVRPCYPIFLGYAASTCRGN